MKVNYYHRKDYNKYLKTVCNIIKYKNTCDKKVIDNLFKSDTYLIKKLKLNGDTDTKVFEMLKNI